MQVSFSLFPYAEAPFSKRRHASLDWEAFVEGLSEWEFVDEKLSAQLLVPATFDGEATTRKKEGVDEVFLASLDVDGVSVAVLDEIEDLIRSEGLSALIYSTWRNPDSVRGIGKKGEKIEPSLRFRVLFPLSRPVSLREWPFFWEAYNEHFLNLADTSCKDPSRGYFVPALPTSFKGSNMEELARQKVAFIKRIDGGSAVDVDRLLSGYESAGLLRKEKKPAAPPSKNAKVDREQVEHFAKTLRRRKRDDLQELGYKILKGLRGEIFEAPGNRDNTVFKIAKELAVRFPDGDPSTISEMFEGALAAMEEEEPGAPSVDNFKTKLERAQGEERARRDQAKREAAKKETDEQSKLQKLRDSRELVTEEEIEAHLRHTGQKVQASAFKLILSFQGGYYFFTTTSGYVGPYKLVDFLPACRKHLQDRAAPVGFALEEVVMVDDGPPRLRTKTREDLMKEYGTVVAQLRHHYGDTSYFDYSTDTLHISYIKEMRHQAAKEEAVDRWIDVAFGEYAEVVRDWMSQVPNLNRALAALCMIGPPDVGKSAFAEGMARLWSSSCALMRVALGDFNGELLQTPVVFADEDLPRDFRGRVRSEELRSLISSGSHSVNRKGLPRVELDGYLRCIVALNNIEKFSFGNAKHSAYDVDAIKKRFLIVEMKDPSASQLFDYMSFVEGGAIARHALWLSENRARKDDRFGVTSNSGAFVALADKSVLPIMDVLLERVIERPMLSEESRAYKSDFSQPILLAPGKRLFVSSDLLSDLKFVDKSWESWNKRDFSSTLSAISLGHVSVKLAEDWHRKRFYEIDNNKLFSHYIRGGEDMTREEFDRALCLYHDADYLSDLAPKPSHKDKRQEALRSFEKTRSIFPRLQAVK